MLKEAVNDSNACAEIRKLVEEGKIKAEDVVEELSTLSLEDLIKLGSNFRKFPIGCDLVDVGVGISAVDLSIEQIVEYSLLADMLGFSLHICAYSIAELGEKHGIDGVEILKMIRELTDVPMDMDHFGEFGPMRFPEEIETCDLCYFLGKQVEECPRKRACKRIFEKEKECRSSEEWVGIVGMLSTNVIAVQGGEAHTASFEEMKKVARLARELGKGLATILYAGDGYEDLIEGLKAAQKLGADVLFIEGGPYAKDRAAYVRAVVAARILSKGKVVGTNGAYEDQLRLGLRAGVNTVLTGFPNNHHGYMCGYSPGSARRGNFGLPRIVRIIKEEVKPSITNAPAQRRELEAIARGVKLVEGKFYPEKIFWTSIGDAHWFSISKAPVAEKVKVSLGELNGEKVALLGGRYVSWALAERFDEVIISDPDPWVESITVRTLQEKGINAVRAYGDDKLASEKTELSIITTLFPDVALKILKKVPDAVVLI